MKNKYLRYPGILACCIFASMAISGCSNSSPVTTTKPAGIVVVTPSMNEVISGGTQNYQITWTGTGITTQKSFNYSLNNGSTWTPIGNLNADVNSYNWNVPNIPSTQALIRITDNNGLSGSSGVFTISFPIGEMDATISGTSFKSVNAATKAGASNTIVLKASVPLQSNKTRDSVSLTMIIPTSATPPYSIDISNDANALINYCIVSYPSGNCNSFQAKKGVGSGTIKITNLSTTIEGTFSGTLPSTSGAGSVTINGGAFKALLP